VGKNNGDTNSIDVSQREVAEKGTTRVVMPPIKIGYDGYSQGTVR